MEVFSSLGMILPGKYALSLKNGSFYDANLLPSIYFNSLNNQLKHLHIDSISKGLINMKS